MKLTFGFLFCLFMEASVYFCRHTYIDILILYYYRLLNIYIYIYYFLMKSLSSFVFIQITIGFRFFSHKVNFE